MKPHSLKQIIQSAFSPEYNLRGMGFDEGDRQVIKTRLVASTIGRDVIVALLLLILGLFYFIKDPSEGFYWNEAIPANIRSISLIAVLLLIVPSAAMLCYAGLADYKKKESELANMVFAFIYYLCVAAVSLLFTANDYLRVGPNFMNGATISIVYVAIFAVSPLFPKGQSAVIMTLEFIGFSLIGGLLVGNWVSFYQYYVVIVVFAIGSLYIRALLTTAEAKEYQSEIINKHLAEISYTDSLTGTFNRHALNERLVSRIPDLLKNKARISLIMIDIDDFKKYNDAFSHLKGDECLKRVVSAIATNLSGSISDIYRFGGEEFLIFLIDKDEKAELEICRRILQAVYGLKMPAPEGCPFPYVTVSLGLDAYDYEDEYSFADQIKNVDSQLYNAKKNGKDCISIKDQIYPPVERK